MSFAGRNRERGHSFDTEFVPDRFQVPRLVELHLVRHRTCAKLLVGRILQVPPSLVFLHVLAKDSALLAMLSIIYHSPPHLQVLHSIALFVLGGSLPGDDVCSEGGKPKLKYVGRGQYSDEVTSGGINDRNPEDTRY
jgi:hypothetical protein